MIDENILKSLESNIQDPSYSVIISKFAQPKFCNKDRLEIKLQQYNPNLEEIIENKENIIIKLKETLKNNNITIPSIVNSEIFVNSCIEKTLIIDSFLDTDKNKSLFIPKLTGSLSNEEVQPLNSPITLLILDKNGIHFIEKDYPNYFNKTRFRIRDDKLYISIPNKINTFTYHVERVDNKGAVISTTNKTENDVVDGQLALNIRQSVQNGSDYYKIKITYTLKNDITTQKIESITTPFEKEIELTFNNVYIKTPGIVVTMDEDKKPFTSYIVDFTKNKKKKIIGCKITFKNVKRMKEYDDLNITIIGPNGWLNAYSNWNRIRR